MNRGNRPKKAIAEAKVFARKAGFQVGAVETPGLPYDFMAMQDGKVTLVRVRRIRYRKFELEEIEFSCKEAIAALREIQGNIARELWVRGPDRPFVRYAVTDASVVIMTVLKDHKKVLTDHGTHSSADRL